jgi:ring-1,2-phenylacetyl-CoA epoxidase subunit PaaC
MNSDILEMPDKNYEAFIPGSPFSGTAGFIYSLHLADNALILGQRNSEWTGHGPVLEQDIAITNILLDLIGQSRYLYDYAATLYNGLNEDQKQQAEHLIPRQWKSYNREMQEDDLAFLRDEHQYLNLLITELPRGDWATTVLRQFFFSAFQFYYYEELKNSADIQLSAIAEKSLKEVAYHLRWSSEWVIRLGDGTEESTKRIKNALADLWSFTGEMFLPTDYEEQAANEGIGVAVNSLKQKWMTKVNSVFSEAMLEVPKSGWMQGGGKQGKHTEYMGYLLSEMQYLQRTFPNSVW